MQEAASRAKNGTRQNPSVLELFPDSARIESGELSLGGMRASDLAARYGTPLVVYCEETLRARAREIREAVPEALLLYATKAFPNVAVLRLLAEEGLGAEVASLGELAFARAAGIEGERLFLHGNAKSGEEMLAADHAGATIVLDTEDEAGSTPRSLRVLLRVTLGVEADTHEAIRTGHHGSKFGLPPEAALRALERAFLLEFEVVGLHIHVGSQVADTSAHEETVRLLADFAVRCRDAFLGWTPALVDVGGGFAVRHVPEEPNASLGAAARAIADSARRAWEERGLPQPQIVLEPGRALVGQAGVTLYRVRSVKRLDEVTWVAVDGGMSDNPRPQLYGARYTAMSAKRADEPETEAVSIAGLHCESGDVLIDDVLLPSPRQGDLLAVPATGAYTLAMGSNFNATPRPAAVLVRDGQAQVIRRRETVDDLLALEDLGS
jgi:diaminopimelate decarboxylase